MAEAEFRRYRYRWVVLAVFMFVNLTIQVLWAGYSAITGPAAEFYGVSDLAIGLLAMVFMIAFIPLSLPVSWAIDTYGFTVKSSKKQSGLTRMIGLSTRLISKLEFVMQHSKTLN